MNGFASNKEKFLEFIEKSYQNFKLKESFERSIQEAKLQESGELEELSLDTLIDELKIIPTPEFSKLVKKFGSV